jgi:hypothetical protein
MPAGPGGHHWRFDRRSTSGELVPRFGASVPRVDVDDHDAARFAGGDGEIGSGPTSPPAGDRCAIATR